MNNSEKSNYIFDVVDEVLYSKKVFSLTEEMDLQNKIINNADEFVIEYIDGIYNDSELITKVKIELIFSFLLIKFDITNLIDYVIKREHKVIPNLMLKAIFWGATKYNIEKLNQLLSSFRKYSYRYILILCCILSVDFKSYIYDISDVTNPNIKAVFNLYEKIHNKISLVDDDFIGLDRGITILIFRYLARTDIKSFIDIMRCTCVRRIWGYLKTYPLFFISDFYNELKLVLFLNEIKQIRIPDSYRTFYRFYLNKKLFLHNIENINLAIVRLLLQTIVPEQLDVDFTAENFLNKMLSNKEDIKQSRLDKFIDSEVSKDLEIIEKDNLHIWKTRPKQYSFRKDILKRFNGKCLLCSITIKELLEAAHIIPKNEFGNDGIENGLLLCSLHHKAFDTGLFIIEPYSFKILTKNNIRKEDLNITNNFVKEFFVRVDNTPLVWRWNKWLANYFDKK